MPMRCPYLPLLDEFLQHEGGEEAEEEAEVDPPHVLLVRNARVGLGDVMLVTLRQAD